MSRPASFPIAFRSSGSATSWWSSLTAENEDQAISLVRRFQAAVRAVVSGDQGRIVKFIGDAALVESKRGGGSQDRGRAARAHAGGRDDPHWDPPGGRCRGAGRGPVRRWRGTAQRIQTGGPAGTDRRQRGRLAAAGTVRRIRFEPLGEQSLKESRRWSSTWCSRRRTTPERRPGPFNEDRRAGAGSGSRAQERSIAVLPFLNLSSDAENEYFSDGISEEILNALVKVSDLKVASRTSSFAFKGHQGDVREIAESSGVATVLEEASARRVSGSASPAS